MYLVGPCRCKCLVTVISRVFLTAGGRHALGHVVEVAEVDVAEEADHLPNDLALAILNYAVVATFLIIYFMMLKMMLTDKKVKTKT